MRPLLAVVFFVLGGSAMAEPGLVDWVAKEATPSPKAALRVLSGLDLRWRPVGAAEWADKSDGLFTSSLKASAWHGGIRLDLVLTATRAATQPTEIIVRCPFDPSAWRRQFYPRLPYLVTAPDAPASLRFAADATDATTFAQVPQMAFYPFGVLENDRAFVLWGSPDVGRYAVLSPNAIAPGAPCLSLRPKRLAVGQRLDFDLILKRFAKPECRYRDVLRWYLQSCFSSDPLVRDLFPWDGRMRARRFPVGNVGSGIGRLAEPGGDGTKFLEVLRRRHVTGLWFQGWGSWDETYPTEGSWLTEYWSRLSFEQVRDEIAWERKNGISPYMYMRQFLSEQGTHTDRPPYRDWVGHDENGDRQAYSDAAVPDAIAAELGFHTLQQGCADFGNADFLAWYEGRVKACMDIYQPAGIAWDMGWGAGPTWGYSRSNPRVINGDGMLRAQADLWKWLPSHHPEMRAIANEAFGTPSQMFADGILIEGGFAVGKTELDYEAAKALGTTVISYEYPEQYAARLAGLPTESARYVQLRYRALGLNTASGRYVVYPSQEIVGKEGTALGCSDLISDGEWHIATFDMRKLPNIAEIKGLAFGMESAADEAHLWVDYLRFSATPDGPPLAVGPRSFPSNITAADAAAFEPRPGWLGNPAAEYGVRRDGDVLEAYVRGKGWGMSWSFFTAGADLAQEYLKVVSLGACLGAGVRGEWETLDAFSAQAMALPPLVGSHDVEVAAASSGVTASAWGGGGRLLVAAYNGNSGPRSVTVEISAKVAARPGPAALSRVLGRDALPARPGPTASIARSGALRLSVRLEPGEELLWGSWGWE